MVLQLTVSCNPSTAIYAVLDKRMRIMTIEEILVQKHGPLMTVVALAESLDRSPEGLRMCLRGGSDWAKKINETKVVGAD